MSATAAATHHDHGHARGLVVLAASAGGLRSSSAVLTALPKKLGAAVVLVQHRTRRQPQLLLKLLQKVTQLQVVAATDGVSLHASVIYLVPPDLHAVVTPQRTLQLFDGRRIRHVLSSANPLFESAAMVFGPRLVAVVLTGGGSDATDGVQLVTSEGGTVIIEDPSTAHAPSMPLAALRTGAVHAVLRLGEIGPTITSIVSQW